MVFFRLKLLLSILNIIVLGVFCDNTENLAKKGYLRTYNETEPIMNKILQGKSYNGIITSEEEQYFDFIVKKKDEEGFPDIMIILDINNLHGNANLYCAPFSYRYYNEWVSIHNEGSDYVFISRNSTSYLYATLGNDEAEFVCYIDGDSSEPTSYTLSIDIDYTPRTLVQEEQDVIKKIYDKCCEAKDSCSAWKERDIFVTHKITDDDINEEIVDFDFCHMPLCVCDDDGHLLRLTFRELQLSCELPYKELKKLTRLQRLYLGSNYFIGDIQKIAKHLSKLKNLEFLDLQGLYLEGSLTPESEKEENYICTLLNNNLTSLHLDSNKDITGPIPDCLLNDDTLTHLSISNCNLNSEIPDIFENSKLEYLVLDNSSIFGTFPQSLSKAQHLRSLSFVNNKLEGNLPDDMCDSDYFNIFLVGNNLLSGPIPEPFGSSKSLKYIYLYGNNFDKMPSGWIHGMASDAPIEQIIVDNNTLTGEFPLGLAQTNIQIISFTNNNISGELPAVNNLFPNGPLIYFRNNQLSGNLPEEWSTIGMFKGTFSNYYLFHVLDLSYNNMSGKIPDVFYNDEVPRVLRVQKSIILTGNNFDCINKTEDIAIVGVDACDNDDSIDDSEISDDNNTLIGDEDLNNQTTLSKQKNTPRDVNDDDNDDSIDDSEISDDNNTLIGDEDLNNQTTLSKQKNTPRDVNDDDGIVASHGSLDSNYMHEDDDDEKYYKRIGFIAGIIVLLCIIVLLSVIIVLLVIRNKRNYVARDMEFCSVDPKLNDRVKLRENGIDSSAI